MVKKDIEIHLVQYTLCIMYAIPQVSQMHCFQCSTRSACARVLKANRVCVWLVLQLVFVMAIIMANTDCFQYSTRSACAPGRILKANRVCIRFYS